MSETISRHEWNSMGSRMAILKQRLAKQEQRAHVRSPLIDEHDHHGHEHHGHEHHVPRSALIHKEEHDNHGHEHHSHDQRQSERPPPPAYHAVEERRQSEHLSHRNSRPKNRPASHAHSISSDAPRPSLRDNEYDVVWDSGTLGLIMAHDEVHNVPSVQRHTGRGTFPGVYDVSPGDMLIFVNEHRTSDYEMKTVMSWLGKFPKPIHLRFRRPSSQKKSPAVLIPKVKNNEYEILWEEGKLGLSLEESYSGEAVIRRVTGKGTSNLQQVRVGDEIVLVNDKKSFKMGFEETMRYLCISEKPVIIRFRRALPVVRTI